MTDYSKVELIAEIGINHNGDMELAKKLIDVSYSAGCDYVKFQKRDIDLVYTKEELASPRESPWGKTFRQQKEGIEFNHYQYLEIQDYCRKKSIKWFASVWDIKSFEMMEEFDIPFIKIPSALLTNYEILKKASESIKQTILTTGMSDMEMIENAINVIGKAKIYCIMHCTSTYPSQPFEMNMNCIKSFKEKFPWTKIGFSNHSPGLIYIPIAQALGAKMIEFHITLDRSSYGSDQAASIEPEGIFKICKYSKALAKAMGDGVKRIYDSEIPIMNKLRR